MTVAHPTSGARQREYQRWRLRHSLWLLAPLLGFGFLSFVGFVYCAIRVRERRWVVIAAASVAFTLVGYVLGGTWTNSAGDASTAAAVYILDLWIASVVLACVMNRDYLAWRAQRELDRAGPA